MISREAGDHALNTLDSIGDGVLSTDLAGHITYLNPKAEAMTGWSLQEAAGRPFGEVFRLVDGATQLPARNPMTLAVERREAVGLTANCLLVRRDGHEAAIEDSAAPMRDRDGHVVGAVIVFRDVGAALEMSREMTHLAQHDALTGLPGRLLLEDRLTEAIALAQRNNTLLAVLFLDIDGFKTINDTRGHAAGDQVLRSIARRLRATLRQSDTISRYSGDEFVVVLTTLERAEDVALVAAKALRAANGPHTVDTEDVTVTVSLGAAVCPADGCEAGALIAHADAAMYDAKRSGARGVRRAERMALAT